MSQSLDFYYDIASPYSYLAADRIVSAASSAGVTVRWKPVLLGGIFRATGNVMPASVAARAIYLGRDLQRWAEKAGTPFQFSSSFPHNSLVAMRALTAAPTERVPELSQALYRAAWVENQDVSDPEIVAVTLGEDGARLVEATRDPEIKAKLMATTQEAIDAGAFGAPSFVVGSDLFWGNDRLEMAVEYAQRSSEGA